MTSMSRQAVGRRPHLRPPHRAPRSVRRMPWSACLISVPLNGKPSDGRTASRLKALSFSACCSAAKGRRSTTALPEGALGEARVTCADPVLQNASLPRVTNLARIARSLELPEDVPEEGRAGMGDAGHVNDPDARGLPGAARGPLNRRSVWKEAQARCRASPRCPTCDRNPPLPIPIGGERRVRIASQETRVSPCRLRSSRYPTD